MLKFEGLNHKNYSIMPTQKDIRILQWPDEKAQLEHHFNSEEAVPVSITFNEAPAHVNVTNDRRNPLNVDMNMNLRAIKDIPLCIKICEPICAVSNYTVGLSLLGRPVVSISVRGTTKLAQCSRNPVRPVCLDFTKRNAKGEQSPVTMEGVQFHSLDDSGILNFTTMGLPQNRLKMSIPYQGIRIDFPSEVNHVSLTIVNYGQQVIEINAFNNANLVDSISEIIHNTTSQVDLKEVTLTALEIKGGSNEAALYNVCYETVRTAENEPIVVVE